MRFFQLLRLGRIGLAGLSLAGLSLIMVQPVLAKTKATTKQTPAPLSNEKQVGTRIMTDAVEICDLMVADKRELLAKLENSGWNKEVSYDVGNAPYYKEITASRTYQGAGDAEIWGFMENYPGVKIGYCSFTIPSPEIDVPVGLVKTIQGAFKLTGEIQKINGGVYSSWQDTGTPPSVFVHTYQNGDTFVYQVTRILANPADTSG